MIQNLAAISDEKLIGTLKEFRKSENVLVADIVRYLVDIDSRQLYCEQGYSSLFHFCTKGLGYSEGAAQRRIVAVPRIAATGEVNRGSTATPCVNTPNTQSESSFTSPVAVEERFSLSFEVDAECMDLIEDAKRYSGKMKLSDLFKLALKEYVKRKQPKVATVPVTATAEVKTKSVKPQESRVLKPSRYIPRKVKDAVRIRDGEKCTYVSPEGRHCNERVGLQFDHCEPFAFGGKNDTGNLRLRCSAHNQFYADQVFGREYMIQKRMRK